MEKLFVYSGKVKLCEVGLKTGRYDDCERELHTGDIVIIYHTEDQDGGWIDYICDLSVVVCEQFGESSGESSKKFYIMGIKDAFIRQDNHWNFRIVKRFCDVVPNEHWKEYGFNHRSE